MDILGIPRSLAFIHTAIFAYCMCGGTGCSDSNEKWSDNSASTMTTMTNLLQSAVECVGKPIYTDPKWRQLSHQCEKLDDQMLAITDVRERLRLAAWIERSVYKDMESQTNNAATLEFYYSALKTMDSLVNVLWKTTGDTNLVLGVWERFHRKGRAVASSCYEERKKLEPEYKRLKRNSRYIAHKMTQVKMSDLTSQELEMFKEEQEIRGPIEERYRYLDDLVNGYRGQLVDYKGCRLANGDLYARFKKLSSEERDRLAAYTIEEYITRSMR